MNLIEAKTKYGKLIEYIQDRVTYYFRPLTCGELLSVLDLQQNRLDPEMLIDQTVDLCILGAEASKLKPGTRQTVFGKIMEASNPDDQKVDVHYKTKQGQYLSSRVVQMIKPVQELGLNINPMEMTITQVIDYVALIEALGTKKKGGPRPEQQVDPQGPSSPGEIEYDKGKYSEVTATAHAATSDALARAMAEKKQSEGLVDKINKKNEKIVSKLMTN